MGDYSRNPRTFLSRRNRWLSAANADNPVALWLLNADGGTVPSSSPSFADKVRLLNPVGWWRFGEPPGSTGVGAIIDASGNGHNGQALNGVTMGTTGLTTGDTDTAFTTGNSAGAQVIIPNAAALHPGDTFTAMFLVKRGALGATYSLIDNGASDFAVKFNTAGQIQFNKSAVSVMCTSTAAITDANPHVIIVTKSGAVGHIYIDGADVSGAFTNATIVASSGPTYIGSKLDGTEVFPGVLDEPFILNYAMTPAQIAAFYATWIQGAPAAPNNSGQGSGLVPELSWSAQRLDMTWEKIGSGLSRGINPAGSQFTHAFEGSIGGPASASFVLDDKLRRGRPDLEHFTPVVAHSGAVPVFSGRVIRTPEVRGEKYQRHVEIQGWKEHLKDDWWDKTCLVSDLSKWVDMRTLSGAVLTKYTQKGKVQSDGEIMLAWANTTPVAGGDYVGVVFDAGPNNLISDWSFDYLSSNNWANGLMYVAGNSIVDVDGTGGQLNSIGATNIVNNAGASGTFTGRFATPQRYICVFMYCVSAFTIGADVYFKITGARVSTSATYLTSGASTLYASTIIGAALTAKCPLISTDQSGIAATAFAIPEFYTDWMQSFSIIDKANAYHGWQVLVSADPVARVSYRAIPTTPTYAVGVVDEYEFDNPSTYDGSEVYSQVIGKYTDAAGVNSYVAVSTPTSVVGVYTPSSIAFTNPSFTTNITGWTATVGVIARDTATFHSTPASMRMTTTGTIYSDAGQCSGLTPGKMYRVAYSAYHATGDTFGVRLVGAVTDGPVTGLIAQTIGAGVWTTGTIDFSAPASGSVRILLGGSTNPVNTDTYFDDFSVSEVATNVVTRRGFTKTKLVDFSSKMTAAAATQVCQIILDASQFPPLKGTLKVRGHIRRYGTGAHIHVSQLKLGEAILLEDETDPNTGAIGRIGIIMQFTYDQDTQTATIAIDSNKNFVENLLARMGAVS